MKNVVLWQSSFTLKKLLIVVVILSALTGAAVLIFANIADRNEEAVFTICVETPGYTGDKEIGAIILGEVKLDFPERIVIGNSEVVSLTLKPPEEGIPKLIEGLTEVSEGVQFYSVMAGEINVANCSVSPASPQYKEVSFTSVTDWKWVIAPNTIGKQSLVVELSTPVQVQGYEERVTRAVYSRSIQITVEKPFDLVNFLKVPSSIVGIISSIVVIIGAIFGWLGIKKRKKQQKARKSAVNPSQ